MSTKIRIRDFIKGSVGHAILGLFIVLGILIILTSIFSVSEIDEVFNKILVSYLITVIYLFSRKTDRSVWVSVGLLIIAFVFFFDGVEEFQFIPENSLVDSIEDYVGEYAILAGILIISIGYLRELIKKEIEIRKLNLQSLRDPLTNAYNRRALQQMYDEKEISTPISFCYIDLNDFKEINDTQGHEVGDAILVAFSDIVRNYLRGGDYLFRLGGDEFLLLLANIPSESAHKVLERIRDAVKRRIPVDFSYGCYTSEPGIIAMKDILRIADQNMYKNKTT